MTVLHIKYSMTLQYFVAFFIINYLKKSSFFTETVVGIVYTSIMKWGIYHITGPKMVKVTEFGSSTSFVTFLSLSGTPTVEINMIKLWLADRHLFQEKSIRIIRKYVLLKGSQCMGVTLVIKLPSQVWKLIKLIHFSICNG